MTKDAKITLHQEGTWWLAFHTKSLGQEHTGRLGREAVSWVPPKPNDAGWVHAMNIWVPHGELNGVYTADEAKRTIAWFDPAEPGHRVGVHVVLITPNEQRGGALGEYVGGFRLRDGRVLLVCRTHTPYPTDLRGRIDGDRTGRCIPANPEVPVSRCLVWQVRGRPAA